MPDHWILAATGDFWPVPDPILWCLEHAADPLLERAQAGLLAINAEDADRLIRLVTRRCALHFIELRPGNVTIHHWVKLADLRPFFKKHGLAHKAVKVVLRERKHNFFIVTCGEEFLYGLPLARTFPFQTYQEKVNKQDVVEMDDGHPAPCSWSNFCWPGVEPGVIPWMVLKSAWQREKAPACLNCDKPMIVFEFGFWRATLLNAYPRFRYLCLNCQRTVNDSTNWEVEKWLLANLHPDAMPKFKRDLWGTLVPWQPGL